MSVEEIPRDLGRYVLYDQIASGGMATVHFGRMHGAVGFSRLVAIKRLHRNFATDAHFVQMFLDEARLAARLDHPNVVSTLDVVADDTEVFLVMEHILGEALEAIMPREGSTPVPLPIASAIMCNVLEGLHGAHEATDDTGAPLGIVHRDVSPHNVLVGVDGVARVFDFGIAKATTNTQETREGVVKGKVTYMAPEQVWGTLDRRADIYAAGVILWELVAGRRRHAGENNDSLFLKLAKNELETPAPPTSLRDDANAALDEVIARATHHKADQRYATAREMAVALEAAIHPAPARDVSKWVREVAGSRIERRSAIMRRIESDVAGSSSVKILTTSDPASGGTGSVRIVTGTMNRTALTSTSSVGPSSSSGAPSSMPHPEAHRRSWTLPAALLAFTAAMLLVGLRALSKHPTPTAEHTDSTSVTQEAPHAAAAALPPPSATPAVEIAPVPPVASTAPPAGNAGSGARAPHVSQPAPQPFRAPSRPDTPANNTPKAEPANTPAPVSGHKPGCESPFAIGPDGIRQIKPECM